MDYRDMTLLQLRAAAKEKGLRGISTLKKEQLIERLMDHEAPAGTEKPSSYPHEGRRAERPERNFRTRMERENGNTEERTGHINRRNEEMRAEYERHDGQENGRTENGMKSELESLDSGEKANGILEVMPDGFGFIRCENYLPGENDVYVSPSQIRRFNLKTGDILVGNTRVKTQNEKYSALLYVESVNGYKPYEAQRRKSFEDLTPIFPNERIRLEIPGAPVSMRMVDLLSPIGKGQRGMIVSQPKTGKTTLLKQIAKSITTAYKDMKLIILLIDERPEEVTDIREYIEGPNAEVIYSTFDELPEHHKRVS